MSDAFHTDHEPTDLQGDMKRACYTTVEFQT